MLALATGRGESLDKCRPENDARPLTVVVRTAPELRKLAWACSCCDAADGPARMLLMQLFMVKTILSVRGGYFDALLPCPCDDAPPGWSHEG